MLKIKANRIKCNLCGTVIESKYRHDFAICRCGACFTDGGRDYLRRGYLHKPDDYTDLTEYYIEEKEEGRAVLDAHNV